MNIIKSDLNTPPKRLIHLLKETGYNQPELSQKIPVSVSTINRWFNDNTVHIDKKKRDLICDIMGFDHEWVEEGDDYTPDYQTERNVLLESLRDSAKNLYEGLDKLIQLENRNDT